MTNHLKVDSPWRLQSTAIFVVALISFIETRLCLIPCSGAPIPRAFRNKDYQARIALYPRFCFKVSTLCDRHRTAITVMNRRTSARWEIYRMYKRVTEEIHCPGKMIRRARRPVIRITFLQAWFARFTSDPSLRMGMRSWLRGFYRKWH